LLAIFATTAVALSAFLAIRFVVTFSGWTRWREVLTMNWPTLLTGRIVARGRCSHVCDMRGIGSREALPRPATAG